MPSRNIIRFDGDDYYYHVYNRGIGKGLIYRDASDKQYFLYLISRHLSEKPVVNKDNYPYPHYKDQVELLCYCLMDNHFHLMFYQVERGTVTKLMKSITVAYIMYFNRKYKRSGPLFENRFKSALIENDSYLIHVSRYIHLNPRSWKYFKFSSINYYRKGNEPQWLSTRKVLEQHSSRADYIEFIEDYVDDDDSADLLRKATVLTD